MTPPILASFFPFDTVVALVLVGLAAAWIVRQAARTFSKRGGGGCDCPNESVCGPKGPASADFSAAAARAVGRMSVASSRAEPK